MQGLLDNKKDYIKDIQDLISIPIAEKIYSLYNESEGLKSFQKKLINIPKWNNHIITEERSTKEVYCKEYSKWIFKTRIR